MPLDITADLWEALRDRNRETLLFAKFEFPNGTFFYGGLAGQYFDTTMNDGLIDRRDLEAE